MNPAGVLFGVMLMFSAFGVPFAYLFINPANRSRNAFFQTTRYLRDSDVFTAYYWTLYACAALIIISWLLGVFRRMDRFQRRDIQLPPDSTVRKYWWLSTGFGVAALGVMYYQAGFQIPALMVIGKDYVERARLRTHFGTVIHPTLLSIDLTFIVSLSLALAFLCIRKHRWKYRIASVMLLLATAAFSLAKSQVASCLTVVVFFAVLVRPVPVRRVLAIGLIIIACIIPGYYITGLVSAASGSVAEQLAGRILYGQWLGLPYYFLLFEHEQVAPEGLLPPYLQFRGDVDSPQRRVMLFIEPYAALTGVAGSFPAFFPGEAYAVGGILGVLLAPFLLAFQLWIVAVSADALPKNILSVQAISWFLFKYEVGLLSGISAFLISAFTIMLVPLAAIAVLRVTNTVRRARLVHAR